MLTEVDKQHATDHLPKMQHLIGNICRDPFIVHASAEKPDNHPEAKLVHWIRHGQAFHNLLALVYKQHEIKENAYLKEEAHDPPLTALGRQQAAALCERAKTLNPQVVVVSPLSRATKTGLIAFDHLVGKVPFIAHDSCRERSGASPCDSRQSVTDAKKDFPAVEYGFMASDLDDYFQKDWRENHEEMSKRGYEFLKWLRLRDEVEIVVATHSSFLFALFNVAIMTGDAAATGLAGWFATGEMRSVWLWFEDVDAAESPSKRLRLEPDVNLSSC